MGVLVIAEGKTIIFRSALFVGLGSVVATIIYLTPVPDQYPQSCTRPCHELDWPMICRVKLTLERYQSFSKACGNCPKNASDCYNKYCITVDGGRQGMLTANRQFPGPSLQVCQNDIIVVDIVNRIPGQSFGVHWRGQSQKETPFMDGVPMVTQCPILSFTTFQYKFRASNPGTHMWQINTGEELLETLFGAFIVKKPDTSDMHRKLYDVENSEHVVIVHTLSQFQKFLASPVSSSITKLLINGRVEENEAPGSSFSVEPGLRYRFRVIFGGDSNGCHVRFSIEHHELQIFALDGNPIKPKNVFALRLAPGERVDFVLTADQPTSTYQIRATPEELCEGLTEVTARLQYKGVQDILLKEEEEEYDEEISPERKLDSNPDSVSKDLHRICPDEIESRSFIPKELAGKPDSKFFLFYKLRPVSSQSIYNSTFIALEDTVKIPQTNNITMMYPSSPLLTQISDIRSSELCDTSAEICNDATTEGICECIHVLNIRLGAVVELVLINQDQEKLSHVFHLHGYNFYVVGSIQLDEILSPDIIKSLDRDDKLVNRNFDSPVIKDTIAVRYKGVSVLRFKANNPGYWLLDDEHSSNWSRGMSIILHVGRDSDLPEVPPMFPKCGNWIGPEFFLV